MENKKKFRPFFYYVTKFLSKQKRIDFVKFLVQRKCGSSVINIPDDLATVKNMLFVLPENSLDMLHQIVNIVSIIDHFSIIHKTQINILCEQAIAPYFKNFHGINSVIEYDYKDRYLFSSEFAVLQKKLRKEYIDMCIFLERDPDISLLYLVGLMQAKVRVSYEDIATFPFFNLQIKSPVNSVHKTDRNCIIAKVLGAKLHMDIQWSVSKDMKEEIAMLLRESSISENEWIGGVDIQYFYSTFGDTLAENLVDSLKKEKNRKWYLYVDYPPQSSFLNWLKKMGIPVFSNLSPSRLAALIYKSDLIISGKTKIFELANLLNKPAIGLFKMNELDQYCKQTSQSVGIPYTQKPDEQSIEEILKRLEAFTE